MGRSFSGSTEGASAVILAAGFWRAGVKLTGAYIRSYSTRLKGDETGEIAQFKTVQPEILTVPMTNGRFDSEGAPTKCDKFSMGALSGWEMALEDMRPQGFVNFRSGDYVTIECVGVQQNSNPEFSDMPQFRVSISDKRPSEKTETAA